MLFKKFIEIINAYKFGKEYIILSNEQEKLNRKIEEEYSAMTEEDWEELNEFYKEANKPYLAKRS